MKKNLFIFFAILLAVGISCSFGKKEPKVKMEQLTATQINSKLLLYSGKYPLPYKNN